MSADDLATPGAAGAADSAASERPQLCVGDAAPGLAIAEWLKGEPVAALAPGKVYVVEFWAVWCGPCHRVIPHLTELQRKHPKATVIGIADRTPDIAKVKEFVDEKADKIGYTIALQAPYSDGDNLGQMFRDWQEASCSTGFPTTFIVDGAGKIAWIGHPMAVEETLIEVLEGRFDIAAAAAAYGETAKKKKAKYLLLQALDRPDKSADPANCFKEFDKLAEKYPEVAQQLEFIKLFNLYDKAAILACARELLAKARGDGERLYVIGKTLLNAPLDPEGLGRGASNPDVAALAVETLFDVETLWNRREQEELSPDAASNRRILWFQFNDYLARGLAAVGRSEEARARAREALRLGKEVTAPAELLARIEKSLEPR